MIERIENNVLFGSDGELFLASDRHFTIDLLQGRMKIDNRSIRNFRNNLKSRQNFCRDQRIIYAHLVAPDKHAVYRDKFPFAYSENIAEKYRSESEDFLYPLCELSPLPRTYWRTDTHWSVEGQIRIAGIVAEAMGFSTEEVRLGLSALRRCVLKATEESAGDLGVKLRPVQTELMDSLLPDWPIRQFSNGMRSGNDGRIVASYSGNSAARGRLVVFGDSFIALAHTALTVFFKEILFCRTRFMHREIITSACPDFVLTENVERYLSAVRSDEDAPPMLLMAQMAARQVEYRGNHALAIGAMLSGRNRIYREFAKGLWEGGENASDA